MPDGVGQAEEKAVVGAAGAGEGSSHLEAKPATRQQEGDVVEGMAVPLAELVRPDHQGIVEHGARLSGLGGGLELFQKVGELLRKPGVDPD